VTVTADTTFAFERFNIAHSGKVFAVMPYIRKRFFKDVAAFYRQITAGEHIALVSHKKHTKPCKTATRNTGRRACTNGFAASPTLPNAFLEHAPLPYDPLIMGPTRNLYLQLASPFQLTDSGQHLFVLLRREHICLRQDLPATHRNQHEYVNGSRPQRASQLINSLELVCVLPCQCHVYLKQNTFVPKETCARKGTVKRSYYLTESVVHLGRGTIQADGNSDNPAAGNILRCAYIYQSSIGGQRRYYTQRFCLSD
jgi:hypothetical protein